MSGWTGGLVPQARRCPETRAHYAHEWYTPLRTLCPGGPDEVPPPPVAEVMDMREPGEAFCSDCPDHEACMTAYPCSMVKRVDREARMRAATSDPSG